MEKELTCHSCGIYILWENEIAYAKPANNNSQCEILCKKCFSKLLPQDKNKYTTIPSADLQRYLQGK